MLARHLIEKHEKEILAPYATLSCHSRGRKYKEEEHPLRTAFQRDRDRVLHSTAFRRLGYKTQVFVNHEGDHYRTRLTHSLEVSQISRTIARVLNLNEDLTETISISHDLGHGPFGHATEASLSKLMKNHGGFEHNSQSLRIVEVLEERYAQFPGLNLSWEVLNGLKKHSRLAHDHFMSLEAQVSDESDDIAYNTHDLDDGLRAHFFTEIDLCDKVPLWKTIYSGVEKKHPKYSIYHKRLTAIRTLLNIQVEEIVSSTQKNIKKNHIQNYQDLAKCREKIVAFEPAMKKKIDQVRFFLTEQLYAHYRVSRMTDKAQRFVEKIFKVYERSPAQLPPHFQNRIKQDGLYRVICDYIAGMTERYALDEYSKLYEPYERV
jgi:dGTPase